ncbi:metal-dependent hydrolase [Candidatus Woesearchaeota archaeon]|nr:metal-dependent hydrolase [Candidatus Woesearchaeota archaeon]
MYPHAHFITGFLFGVIGWRFGIINAVDMFIIAAGAVLIDIDHYIYYIIRHKDLNPKRFWNKSAEYGITKEENERTFIHHLPGMTIIIPLLFILLFFSLRIGYIAITIYIPHMILDHLNYINKRLSEYHVVDIFGLKFLWNFAQESLFFILTAISMVLLYSAL